MVLRIKYLVLARLLYACAGRRLHLARDIRLPSPSDGLASLLIASNPAAGWQHHGATSSTSFAVNKVSIRSWCTALKGQSRFLTTNNCADRKLLLDLISWFAPLLPAPFGSYPGLHQRLGWRHFPLVPTRWSDVSMSAISVDLDTSVPPKLESNSKSNANDADYRNVADFITRDSFDAAKVDAVEQKWENKLTIEEFLQRGGLLGSAQNSTTTHIIDVRAPGEYAQGHIPGAISVPLFSDDERAQVGTLYKHEGHDSAVGRGLNIVEAKGWQELVSSVPRVREGDELLVYCWRGGMRSGGMAQLLSRAPLRVSTLAGGYKAFRNWTIRQWEQHRDLIVVAGPTGSGKTDVLEVLREKLQQQVIDLEGDANHRGSAFGALGRAAQPTNEHYENILGLQWANFSAGSPVFIEDEGVSVGKVGVPPGLWRRMRKDDIPLFRLQVPLESRVAKLVAEYGQYPPEELAHCCRAIGKRLGQVKVNQTVAWLEERPPKLAEVAQLLLEHYYDGLYEHGASKRPGIWTSVRCSGGDAFENAQRVLATLSEYDKSD